MSMFSPKINYLAEKRLQIADIFPHATLWGINEDGSVNFSRYQHEHGRIRLFCCTHLFSGKIDVFERLKICADILGANEYSICPSSDGNNWVELYYKMTPEEMKNAEIKELKDKLNKLESSTK